MILERTFGSLSLSSRGVVLSAYDILSSSLPLVGCIRSSLLRPPPALLFLVVHLTSMSTYGHYLARSTRLACGLSAHRPRRDYPSCRHPILRRSQALPVGPTHNAGTSFCRQSLSSTAADVFSHFNLFSCCPHDAHLT